MSISKAWKGYKQYLIGAVLLGALLIFLLNNFTSQGVYNVVSCTWNENVCNGTADPGSVLSWDGVCTDGIIDECCDYIDVRLCAGEENNEPWMCDTKYCEGVDEACYAEEEYDDQTGEYNYNCVCKDVNDWFDGPLM